MPITVQISDPCRQRWDTMQADEQSRFCLSCQKTVIDFTAFTDRELVQYLNQPSQTTCGRFHPAQLNRALPVLAPVALSGWGQRLGVFLLGMLWQTAHAQQTQPARPAQAISTVQTPPMSPQAVSTTTHADGERIISGSVVSRRETGEFDPLPGAFVQIKRTSRGVVTDQSGSFQLKIPMDKLADRLILVVASLSFITQEIELRPEAQAITIILQEDTNVLGEVITVSYKKLSPWQRFTRRLFR